MRKQTHKQISVDKRKSIHTVRWSGRATSVRSLYRTLYDIVVVYLYVLFPFLSHNFIIYFVYIYTAGDVTAAAAAAVFFSSCFFFIITVCCYRWPLLVIHALVPFKNRPAFIVFALFCEFCIDFVEFLLCIYFHFLFVKLMISSFSNGNFIQIDEIVKEIRKDNAEGAMRFICSF